MLNFFRHLLSGGRLALAAPVGFLLFIAMPVTMQAPMRGAVAWDVAVVLFLALTLFAVGNVTPDTLRKHAGEQDAKLWIILGIVVVAAAASLAALAFVLQKEEGVGAASLAERVIVACITLIVSWIFVHTMFAIRYAHYFYGDADHDPATKDERRGLAFPKTAHPDFWDFAYYSFVIGMTCQVSDVQVTSGAMRRITLAHGVLSFFFNTGVLALAVNILATAL